MQNLLFRKTKTDLRPSSAHADENRDLFARRLHRQDVSVQLLPVEHDGNDALFRAVGVLHADLIFGAAVAAGVLLNVVG